jgi:HK97 gp10 family phage protein
MGSPDAAQRIGRALFKAGHAIQAEASRLITTGAVSGKNHVPSKPGEPPNEDTGTLRAKIETTQPSPLVVEVRSNAPYAVALELGTSKMAARPYMHPAVANKREEVLRYVEAVVENTIRDGG